MKHYALIFILSVAFISGTAQELQEPTSETSASTATVSPNLRARTLLATAIATAGWSAAQRPTSGIASGTVTRYVADESSTSPIRIRYSGTGSYAVETEYGGVSNRVVVRDGSAARWKGSSPSAMTANSVKSWHFPFLIDLLDLSPADARIEYVGTEQLQGQGCDRIHIWREPDPADRGHFFERKLGSHLTLWIAQATGLPIQVEYRKQNFSRLSFNTRRRVLGDYRSVAGVMVPFYQEEWDGEDKIWTIQFDTVQWSVPLSAADFPLAQGGQQ